MMKAKRVMIPAESKELQKSLWYAWQGAVKDAQADDKCCYHCSSLEHFICNFPLIKTLREKKQLNGKEWTASMKGAWTPLTTANALKSSQTEACKNHPTDSLLESGPLSALAQGQEHS